MNTLPSRTRTLSLLAFLTCSAFALKGADTLPAPSDIFSPKSVLSVYLDAGSIKDMPIWQALKQQGINASQAGKTPFGSVEQLRLEEWPSLKGHDFAELAVALEGDELDMEKPDPNASAAVVIRFAGTVDPAALGADLLGALEKSKPGLSNRIAGTAARIGAADTVVLPAEALGMKQAAFEILAAVGPGADGTILAVGRKERIREYLEGKGARRPPAGVDALQQRRGQFWVFLSDLGGVIRSAAKNPQVPNAAMLGQVASQTEKLREVGVAASFEAQSVGVQLLVGFAEESAAQEAFGQLQGMLGMAQMMAQQGGKQAPAFLGRIKSQQVGKRLLLSTTVQPEDLPGGTGGGPGAGPGAAAAKPLPKVEPVAEVAKVPLEFTFVRLLPVDSLELRRGRFRIANSGDKAVKEARLTFEYLDEKGEKVGEWTRQQEDVSGGVLVGGGRTRDIEMNLFKVPVRIDKVRIVVREVVFTDGTTWREAGSGR